MLVTAITAVHIILIVIMCIALVPLFIWRWRHINRR